MISIYDVIEVLPFEEKWYVNGQPDYRPFVAPSTAIAIWDKIFAEHTIKTIIEVGSWLGSSTRWFAERLPKDGYIISVDTWKGSEEHQAGMSHHHPQMSVLYQQFLSNNLHKGLADQIIPVRMDSLEAAAAIKIVPDLFFLDAAHDEMNVYNDLCAWVPKIKNHALICGDDWAIFEGVRKAVTRYAVENNFEIMHVDNFWMFK